MHPLSKACLITFTLLAPAAAFAQSGIADTGPRYCPELADTENPFRVVCPSWEIDRHIVTGSPGVRVDLSGNPASDEETITRPDAAHTGPRFCNGQLDFGPCDGEDTATPTPGFIGAPPSTEIPEGHIVTPTGFCINYTLRQISGPQETCDRDAGWIVHALD